MSSDIETLAVFGGTPRFSRILPVGQLYFPDWESYEAEMRGIFEREYFTNHGPLARQFEQELADFLEVRHALCVTNATVGLVIVSVALSLTGKVIVPSFTFIASAQALTWAGLEPVFCDVEVSTGHLSVELAEELITEDVKGILGVNLWGGTCGPRDFESLAHHHGLSLFFDSAQAFGCTASGRRLGGYGAAEVFSFHATKTLNSTEGGCITTNDDDLAARMRNIRSSYGAGSPVDVPITTNGRFSEAQAALGRLSLSRFHANVERNAQLWARYAQALKSVQGIAVLPPALVDESNWQTLSCVVDPGRFGLHRDQLLSILKAERVNARRYFYPGCHRSPPYKDSLPQYRDALPNTDALCETVLQLPLGAQLEPTDIDEIVALIDLIQRHSGEIARRFSS